MKTVHIVTYALCDNPEAETVCGVFESETKAVNKYTTYLEESAEELRTLEELDVQVEVRHETGEVVIVIVDQADNDEIEWYRITETEVT